MQTEELTYAVEDNHLIVDRITNSGQHGTYEGLVNLKREWHPTPADTVHTEDKDDVHDKCSNSADREGEVAETNEDVNEDGDEGQDDTPDSTLSDIRCYGRTYLLAADDRAASTLITIDEVLQCKVVCQQISAFKSLEEFALDLAINLDVVLLNAVVRRDTNGLSFCTQSNCRGVTLGECLRKQAANGLWLHLVLEHYHEVATTSKVDTLAEATSQHEGNADNCQCAEDCEALLVLAHEIEVRVLEGNLVANSSTESESEPLILLHNLGVNYASQEYCGKEADTDTDKQCGCETADRTCTEVVKDDSRND